MASNKKINSCDEDFDFKPFAYKPSRKQPQSTKTSTSSLTKRKTPKTITTAQEIEKIETPKELGLRTSNQQHLRRSQKQDENAASKREASEFYLFIPDYFDSDVANTLALGWIEWQRIR